MHSYILLVMKPKNMVPAASCDIETRNVLHKEQKGLDSRAQQSRLSGKQFARINLITSVQSTCNKAERWGNCKAVPVGVKGKLKSWNGHALVGGAAKCWQM